jgi:hypothetical protein
MIKSLLSDRIAEVKDFVMLVNDTARLKDENRVLRDLANRISGFVMYDSLPSEAQLYLSSKDRLDLMMNMKDMPPTVCPHRVQIYQGPCGLMKSPSKEVRGFMYLLTDLLLVTAKSGNRKQKLLKQVWPSLNKHRQPWKALLLQMVTVLYFLQSTVRQMDTKAVFFF